MRVRPLQFSLVAFLACAPACNDGGRAEAEARRSAAVQARRETVAERESDLDFLRSIGYADTSEDVREEDAALVSSFDPKRSYPGYTLYSERYECSASLIDAHGEVVNEWRRPDHYWSNVELLDDGDLLVVGAAEVPRGEATVDHAPYLMRLDWEGETVWSTPMNAHHDVELTPDGQLATLTFDYRRVPEVHAEYDLRDNYIVLLSTDGVVAESASLYDILSADPEAYRVQGVKPYVKRKRWMVDLLHSNSIEWMHHARLEERDPIYSRGNVVITMRHQDAVVIIDWEARKVVWTWGQGELDGPHNATVLDNGRVLIFDNGLGRGWSRVIELDPLTKEIVWEYTAPELEDFHTPSRGSNQRLPNGNTLMAESDRGRLFEVTREGDVVWRYLNPTVDDEGHVATIVRAKRYETSLIDSIRSR